MEQIILAVHRLAVLFARYRFAYFAAAALTFISLATLALQGYDVTMDFLILFFWFFGVGMFVDIFKGYGDVEKRKRHLDIAPGWFQELEELGMLYPIFLLFYIFCFIGLGFMTIRLYS